MIETSALRIAALVCLLTCAAHAGNDTYTVNHAGDLIVDVSPAYILQQGLPYARSQLGIVLDAAPVDVPDRYKDSERAQRIVSVLANAVVRDGVMIVPAKEWEIQEYARDERCRVRRVERERVFKRARVGRRTRVFPAPAVRRVRRCAARLLPLGADAAAADPLPERVGAGALPRARRCALARAATPRSRPPVSATALAAIVRRVCCARPCVRPAWCIVLPQRL